MARSNTQCDALIIGGGHNGLVCAAYLAAGGLKVTVLERRAVVGGAAVTEEFHPGFRNSVAAYTVSLLNPKVIRDLELPRHGLRVVERLVSNFLPTEDGRYLSTGGALTQPEVAKFSAADAARLGCLRRAARPDRRRAARSGAADSAQRRGGQLAHGAAGAAARARVGGRLRKLDMSMRRELLSAVRNLRRRLPRWLVRKRSHQGGVRL